jgi:hypothetical protein
MELPGQSITLTAEQIAELSQQFANFRHDINNNLALIMAGLEVVKHKPHLADRMMATVTEQPPKIAGAVAKFADQFDKTLGIKR